MIKDYWLAFALACYAFLVRTQGILLVLAIAVWLAMQRRWKPLLVLGGMAAATQCITMAFIGFGQYGGQFMMRNPYDAAAGSVGVGDLVARLTANLHLYLFKILPEALVPLSAWRGLSIILGILIICVLVKQYDNH